ncbi:hypothetical protein E2C01_014340 [Portunus trituberculatus]|uniref:Uncharacterized protein n=1 Tax=Portunus trituberculatus TaxID=210409 RepID=A0A5B7DJQ3_PORTR|nr:hypothetical protein [Portunus trituberculatus]
MVEMRPSTEGVKRGVNTEGLVMHLLDSLQGGRHTHTHTHTYIHIQGRGRGFAM